MLSVFLIASFLPSLFSLRGRKVSSTLFKDEHIIFSSKFNITKILAIVDGNKYFQIETSDLPSIFFTISDPKLRDHTCIYVLKGFMAYEILEGGRDSTADYSLDKAVYFGGKDGLYIYHHDSLSAKKFGTFKDDIIQLQKANGTDTIYVLTAKRKLFKIEKNGTKKTQIKIFGCVVEFVLDTSNNIYYIDCEHRLPHIYKDNGDILSLTSGVMTEFKYIQLLRPAFIMEKCIPFFGDDTLYILYSNGSYQKKDFQIKDRPTAYSVDSALYLVTAHNGKMYEFNIMEVLLRSIFGFASEWQKNITKVVLSIF